MNTIAPPPFISFDNAPDDCSEIPMEATHPTIEQLEIFQLKQFIIKQNKLIDHLNSKLSQCQLEKSAGQQEILEFIQQLTKQQERIDSLEAELSQCQMEKEDLEIQNAVFTLERTVSHLPTDARNAKLMEQNARLQVVSDEARRKSDVDKQTIKALEQANEHLLHQTALGSQLENHTDQPIEELRRSSGFSQGLHKLTRQLSRRMTGLSKSDTAPTCSLSRSFCSYTGEDQEEEDEVPTVDSSGSSELEDTHSHHNMNSAIDAIADGTKMVKEDIIEMKDIEAEELKQEVPLMNWLVTARVPTPRAAQRY